MGINFRKSTHHVLTAGILAGAKCKIIRRNPAGSYSIELTEDFGAYKKGDRLCVPRYEMKLDQRRNG
jgi:hypothetical protein